MVPGGGLDNVKGEKRSGQQSGMIKNKKIGKTHADRIARLAFGSRCQSIKEQVNRSSKNKKEKLMMRVGLAAFVRHSTIVREMKNLQPTQVSLPGIQKA